MPDGSPLVKCEMRDGAILLQFHNVSLFDESVYAQLEEELNGLLEEAQANSGVVISLEGVKLVSTAVWGKLFVLSRKLREQSHLMAFCGLGPLLNESVRALRLDRFIPVEAAVESAVKRVKG